MKLVLASLVTLAAVAPWVASLAQTQAPKQDPAPKRDAPRREQPWGTEAEAKRIRESFVGAWRLTSVVRGTSSYSGENCDGYMLVMPDMLSMQLRVAKPTTALPGAMLEGFSAGTYRWSYDPTLLKVVIHTALAVSDLEGPLQWERAGAQREYEVIFVDDQLSLVRRGDAEFNFTRIKPRPEPGAPKAR